MGFLGPVLGALANATVVTDGLYGAPTSTTPSPTSSSSSVWGWLWDSAAAVVLTLARGIVTLVEIAWTSEFAAWIYLAHLVREASELGGTILSRSASVLAAVGSAAVGALGEVLDWALQQIVRFLSPIVAPLKNSMEGWAASMWSEFLPVWSQYNASPTDVSGSLSASLLETLFGNLFVMLLAISVATAVALTVIQIVGMGAGTVVSTLVSLIPPPSEAAGYALGASLIPVGYFSVALVRAAWTLYNDTTSVLSPYFGPLLCVFGNGIAAIQLYSDAPVAVETVEGLTQGTVPQLLVVWEPIVAAVTGLLSIALDIAGHLLGGGEGAFVESLGLIISGGGALFSLFVLLKYWSDLREALQLNQQLIGSGLDALGLAIGLGELKLSA